jgi:acetyltransferase-like isoleucine patch superfamily enzyme
MTVHAFLSRHEDFELVRVTKDVEECSIVAGVPAKFIRKVKTDE